MAVEVEAFIDGISFGWKLGGVDANELQFVAMAGDEVVKDISLDSRAFLSILVDYK